MLIGSFMVMLEATSASKLPISHGRLLHAAFLDLVRTSKPELSERLHNEEVKSFALSLLRTKVRLLNCTYHFKPGDKAMWHISCIGDELIVFMALLKPGAVVRIGESFFKIQEIICDKDKADDTGVTSLEDMKDSVFALPLMSRLRFDFVSPATFRYCELDMPFPKPELIFGSLAEKWNAFSQEEVFDIDKIKNLSKKIVPEKWQGESKRINITEDRGINGFVGSFTFNMSLLPANYRYLFLLLSEFGTFIGVGRLTGQGLGRIKIAYNP